MSYILQTDSAETLTLAEVKTFLKLDGNNDYDNILTPKINEVRVLAESLTGRDFLNKTWKLYLDDWQYCNKILKSKLQSITNIRYYQDGVLNTVDVANYYFTKSNDYSNLYFIDSFNFPDIDDKKQQIEITFVSGYGATANFVPQGIKNAMLSHIEALFEGTCQNETMGSIYAKYKPYTIIENLISFI
jgi:uncharacterized phiE125 gp8 family phage protein